MNVPGHHGTSCEDDKGGVAGKDYGPGTILLDRCRQWELADFVIHYSRHRAQDSKPLNNEDLTAK
jgi:hypothetical protein